MFQIIQEYTKPWPSDGLLHVKVPEVSVEIPVSPDAARRKANSYLGAYVSMALNACDPKLVIGEQSVWRLTIELHLRGLGHVAPMGTIDVDAQNGTIITLSTQQIRAIQDRANAIITRFTPETTPVI